MANSRYPLSIPLDNEALFLDPLPSHTETRPPRRSLTLSASSDWQDIQQQCEALDEANLCISSLTLSFPDSEGSSSNPSQPLYSIKAKPKDPSSLVTPASWEHSNPTQRNRHTQRVDVKIGRESTPRGEFNNWVSSCSTPGHSISAAEAPASRHGLPRGRALHRIQTEPKNLGYCRTRTASAGAEPFVLDSVNMRTLRASATFEHSAPEHFLLKANAAGFQGADAKMTNAPYLPSTAHFKPHFQPTFHTPTISLPPTLVRHSSTSLFSMNSIDSSSTEHSFGQLAALSPDTPHSNEGMGSLYSGLYPCSSLDNNSLLFQHRALSSVIDMSTLKEDRNRGRCEDKKKSFLLQPWERSGSGGSGLSSEASQKVKVQTDYGAFRQEGSTSFCANEVTESQSAVNEIDAKRDIPQSNSYKRTMKIASAVDEKVKLLELTGDPVVRRFGKAGDPIIKRRNNVLR